MQKEHVGSCMNKVNVGCGYFTCYRSQTSEHVSETREDLLDAGPAGGPEYETSKNTEAGLPSLCLKQVFPKYAKQFNYLRLVDRVAALFIRFLGVKGTTKLGPTGFRTFIRFVTCFI